jgi:DNA-binding phage protein
MYDNRYYYTGITIGIMVRIPLTTDQLERGRLLGQALRNARGTRTMVEVASSAGVSVEALRKIETGRSPSPEFFTVAQVCTALGISTDQLVAAPGVSVHGAVA